MKFSFYWFTLLVGFSLFCQSPATANEAILASLKALNKQSVDIEIAPSQVPGISEVTIGLQVLYATNDGAFILGGPLIDAKTGSNLSETSINKARKQLLGAATQPALFRYKAKDARHKITVVTDIDCPHCRRLHNEIPKLQEAGVDVSYIMLPRAGKNSSSYSKTVSAACAKNPEQAITAAMAGSQPQDATCSHPIDEHMALARDLQINSTPSIILDSGQLILGYKTANSLVDALTKD